MIQTATIEHFPVILVGAGEWDGLLDWLRTTALSERRIDESDLAGLRMAGSPAEVVQIVSRALGRQRGHAQRVRRRPMRRWADSFRRPGQQPGVPSVAQPDTPFWM